MFTQATPAIINSLRDANGPWPMVRALGNCQAPLSHRGAVNFAPAPRRTRDGVYGPGAWNPSDYPGLVPNAGDVNGVDIGGMNSNWNTGNSYNSQFFFPTDQYFTQNQFFGGPTFNVQCNANIDYLTNQALRSERVSAKKVDAEEINDQQLLPPAGPPGANGAAGAAGVPGNLVFFGGVFGNLQFAIPERRWWLTGKSPRVKTEEVLAARPHQYVSDAWVRPTGDYAVPTNAISGGTVTITPTAGSVSVPTGVTFNPDTCSVTFSSYTTVYFANTGTVTASLAGSAAATVSIKAVAATEAGSTLASKVPANTGVLISVERPFTERVSAVKNAVLVGVAAERFTLLRQPGPV